MSQAGLSGFTWPSATGDARQPSMSVAPSSKIHSSMIEPSSSFAGTMVSTAPSSPMTSMVSGTVSASHSPIFRTTIAQTTTQASNPSSALNVTVPAIPTITRPAVLSKLRTTRVEVTHTITKKAAPDVTGLTFELYTPLAEVPSPTPFQPTSSTPLLPTSAPQQPASPSPSSPVNNGAIAGGVLLGIAGITLLVWLNSRCHRPTQGTDMEQGKKGKPHHGNSSTRGNNTNDVLNEVQARRGRRNRAQQPTLPVSDEVDLTELANAQGWGENVDNGRFQGRTQNDAIPSRVLRTARESLAFTPGELATAYAWNTPFSAENFQTRGRDQRGVNTTQHAAAMPARKPVPGKNKPPGSAAQASRWPGRW